jgi:hypothetical protein
MGWFCANAETIKSQNNSKKAMSFTSLRLSSDHLREGGELHRVNVFAYIDVVNID